MPNHSKWLLCFALVTTATIGVSDRAMGQSVAMNSSIEKPVEKELNGNQRRRLKSLTKKLANFKKGDKKKNNSETDWFVVGRVAGQVGNFEKIQGQEQAARWGVKILSLKSAQRPNWRYFSRTSDAATADKLVAEIDKGFQDQQRAIQLARINTARNLAARQQSRSSFGRSRSRSGRC